MENKIKPISAEVMEWYGQHFVAQEIDEHCVRIHVRGDRYESRSVFAFDCCDGFSFDDIVNYIYKDMTK